MNDRDRLNALCAVMVRYLVPDGITAQEAISEVIELLDPLPPQREWVGLTDEEVASVLGFGEYTVGSAKVILLAIAHTVEAKLKEKNS